MAIITDVYTARGLRFPSQYVRVQNIHVEKTQMTVTFEAFLTQEQAVNGELPHFTDMISGEFNMDSALNLWEQAYALAKQNWSDGVDA